MKHQEPKKIFNQETATSYDVQRENLASIKSALHLCIRALLSKLPVDARILCVGAGTGSELIELARAFPHWTFTAVEPAPAMLDICRQRAEEKGILSRCTFHEGYLDSLPDPSPFDAATSILVSHFIVNPVDRTQFYAEIASRLRSGAYMVNADLTSDIASVAYKSLLDAWLNMHEQAAMPVNVASFGHEVTVLPREKTEAIIQSGGFGIPVLFFQTLLIHAWISRSL